MSFGAPKPWPNAAYAEDTGQQGEWDSLWIGSHAVPGLVLVRGVIGYHSEVRQAAGSNGARQTFLNYKLAEFDVRVRMWTQTHFDLWLELCSYIQPSAKKPQAWDVYNPALSAQGITKATVLSLTVPERGVGREIDVWHATIKLREWRKPLPGSAVHTPASAQSKAPATTQALQAATRDATAPSKTQTGP